MRPILFLIPVVAAACTAPSPPSPAPPSPVPLAPAVNWADYTALIGSWVDSTSNKKLRTYEAWDVADDSSLIGRGYVLSGGDTVFVEDLKLVNSAGHVVYSARIDTQNEGEWIPFTAQRGTADSLSFENAGHDYPQCIMYVRDGTGGWNVRVSGMEHGAAREEIFHFAVRTPR